MTALIEVILPVFLVLGFGYAVVAFRLFGADAVDALMRFAQNFAVPCLLFRGVAKLVCGPGFRRGGCGRRTS